MRLLLIGAGALGGTILRAVDAIDGVESVQVFDTHAGRAEAVAKGVGKASVADTFEAGLHAADVVLEAASQEAVARYGPHVLGAGRDLIVLSVGALENEALRENLLGLAREKGVRVYVPSGAIGGLDALRSAVEGTVDEVVLTTAKPPAGLPDVPDGSGLDGPLTLFDGPAREAVREFPRNVNVAAALALVGVGFDNTRVRVVADPGLDVNTHTVEVRGAFGSLRVEVRNRPSPENPRSSLLAALSAVALLRRLTSPLQVGT